ncbi:MAG: DUF2304 domain-containing protein [bacterium]|nr:DUF2304 domain-containing protein [bacterium]
MEITKISIFQIIISLVAVAMIYSGTVKFLNKEKSQTFIKFFLTFFIWVGVLAFTLFPGLAQTLSKTLGFGNNLNTLIFAVFVVIFLILFKILNVVEKIERNMSEIVREEALKEIKMKEIKK